MIKRLAIKITRSRKNGKGNRKVVVARAFGQVRRRKVDRESALRKTKARCFNGRAHPLSRLTNRAAGQTNDRELGKTARKMGLDTNQMGLQAQKFNGISGRECCRHAPIKREGLARGLLVV